MPTIRGRCSVCSAAIEIEVSGVFASGALAAPLCPDCTDRRFLESGGAVLQLQQRPDHPRLPLGKITVTPGAIAALADAGQHASAFLLRHAAGDWGSYGCCDQILLTEDEERRGWEATDETAKINKWNLLHGRDTIMSEYTTSRGTRLWVVTRLDRSPGTVVLLPEEY